MSITVVSLHHRNKQTDMLHTTNTIELTQNQQDKNFSFVSESFEKQMKTNDWFHFSFNGTRLNLKSMKFECVFEVHIDKGGFCVTIDIDDKKQVLKSTFKIQEII